MYDRNETAVTTYRRANGSSATVAKPRVPRKAKNYTARAHTPSPEARKKANAERRGYWQVEYDLSKGAAPEPVWGVIELLPTMEQAHQRARARAAMGQKTRVVHKTDGHLYQ